MGEARFSFTRDDLVAAQKAWWMGAARWQVFLKIWAVLAILYAVIAFVMSIGTSGVERLETFGWCMLVAVAVTLCLFALGRLVAPHRARRAFREHKALAGEFTYRWSPEELEITHDRGPGILMLYYQSSILFNAVPKRALAPGDLDAIVGMMRAEGVREWKRFGLIASKAGLVGKEER